MNASLDRVLFAIRDHMMEVGLAFPLRVTITTTDGWMVGRYDARPRPEMIKFTLLAHTRGPGRLVPPIRITLRDRLGGVHKFEITAEGARLH